MLPCMRSRTSLATSAGLRLLGSESDVPWRASPVNANQDAADRPQAAPPSLVHSPAARVGTIWLTTGVLRLLQELRDGDLCFCGRKHDIGASQANLAVFFLKSTPRAIARLWRGLDRPQILFPRLIVPKAVPLSVGIITAPKASRGFFFPQHPTFLFLFLDPLLPVASS